jgi:HAD superfamily hydrolase (TIGR01509 family)
MQAGATGIDADQKMFFPNWSIDQVQKFYESNFAQYAKWVKEEPGAKEVLKTLKRNGGFTGVASNSPAGVVTHLLQHTGQRSFVDAIASVNQVANGKPAPDLIYKVLNDLGCRLQEACYIGDSQFDADAAASAGIYFIGYKRPGDASIQTLSQLLD